MGSDFSDVRFEDFQFAVSVAGAEFRALWFLFCTFADVDLLDDGEFVTDAANEAESTAKAATLD